MGGDFPRSIEELSEASRPFEIEALDAASRRIAELLLEARPAIIDSFRMVGSDAVSEAARREMEVERNRRKAPFDLWWGVR